MKIRKVIEGDTDLEIVISGALRLMQGHTNGMAIFGDFHRDADLADNIVYYRTDLYRDETGALLHNWDSEFLDDVENLKGGCIDWIE